MFLWGQLAKTDQDQENNYLKNQTERTYHYQQYVMHALSTLGKPTSTYKPQAAPMWKVVFGQMPAPPALLSKGQAEYHQKV